MQTELVAGRYRILGELGSGAMGFVWRAHDEVLDRDVALKELRISGGLDRTEARERFVTEARAAARLSHPSIVTVHDVFQESERVLLSMELLNGQTLAEIIGAGPLGAAARPIMREVAAALAVAHCAGVVHRDLKPENIFVTDIGRVVVCDFGLARIGTGGLTEVGTVMGTPGFMAPEQLTGEPVTPSADVFAWGAVAYELASGRPAFGDRDLDSTVALAYKVVHEAPAELRIDDDPAFSSAIATALHKHPDERFSSGVSLLDALDGVMDAPPPVVQPIPTPGGTPRLTGPVVVAVILVALVGGLGAVLLVLLGGDPLAAPPAVETRESGRTDQRVVPFEGEEPLPTPAATIDPVLTESAIAPLMASASSTAAEGVDAAGQSISYDVSNLLDGEGDTAWRTPGDGIGAVITVTFEQTEHLNSVALLPGYDKTDRVDGTDRWRQNRRPLRVRWRFDDGTSVEQVLRDQREAQVQPIDVTTRTVEVEILESSVPTERDFTAISEIVFTGLR